MDTITTIRGLSTCNGSARSVTLALTDVDMHQIAASGEMYDALEGVVAWLDNGGVADAEMVLAQARTALALARGEKAA